MKPLLYLSYRSFINSLKRAFTSPKRLITTLILVGYYLWLFVLRPFNATRGGDLVTPDALNGRQLDFPPLAALEACVFALFAGMSQLMAMSIFGYRASFKPADVDVLFPTPINPKVVLAFRMVRDYLATLIFPILLVVMGWRPAAQGIEALFRNVPNPQTAGYTFRALSLGFVLMLLAWVAIGYALSMYVNRNDRASDRRKWVIGGVIAAANLFALGYCFWLAQSFRSFKDFIALTEQPWLKGFFFTATPATRLVMGPLEGDLTQMIWGGGILAFVSLIGFSIALRQAEWMYDQAAVRGFGAESLRQLQRKGDLVGVVAEAARMGRLKVRRWGWFQRLNWTGFWGIVWKDLLIQWRSIRFLVLLFIIIGTAVAVMPSVASGRTERLGGFTIFFGEGFVTFMLANLVSQSGFSELLRRVDLQKPLPFTPAMNVFAEILAKSIPIMAIPFFGGLTAIALLPSAWDYGVSAAVFFPSVAVLICAAMCTIVLIFPDIEDVAQRGFRGIVSFLGIILALIPATATFLLFAVVFKMLIVGAVVATFVNAGIAALLVFVAGNLYAAFNPSE